MNQRCNSPRVIRLFVCCVALFILLFVPIAQTHAQSQAAMNKEARADFARADAELNKTYQSVLANLPAAESKQKLRETQRAWVASRDAEAARAAKGAEGGSMAPALRYEAMTDLTQKRIKELKAMLDQRADSGAKASSTAEPVKEESPSASETERTSSSTAITVSPDKKWEFVGGRNPEF
jgi:uncharacterized protein YecT (DUF1311 family)